MTRSHIGTSIRVLAATAAIAAMTLGATAGQAAAGGLRNCVDLTGKQVDHVGCWENVWSGDAEYRMTFSHVGFTGATPHDLDPLYVLAPQTDTPQGAPPATFGHDHVVRAIPAQNHGTYSTKLQGFFVFCSGQGIVTGACVPTWTFIGGPDPVPFATTVDGQGLTSTEAIEAAAAAGDVALVDLGPDAVLVATITAN